MQYICLFLFLGQYGLPSIELFTGTDFLVAEVAEKVSRKYRLARLDLPSGVSVLDVGQVNRCGMDKQYPTI